jgi:DNA primase
MTVEEMEDTLSRLGIETVSTRGDEVQGYCPAHLQRTGKSDRNPSWFINADTGAHICFSCDFKGSLYSLISYVQGVDFESAKSWVGSPSDLASKFERLTKQKKSNPIEEQTYITESMLDAFVTPPEFALQDRGLTADAANHYDIRWDRHKENWIIPIRDPYTNKLLGWQEKGHKTRYFNNYPVGVQKSKTLFGFNKYIAGDMIVVESPLDVVRLASVGILGGVATYGASVSIAQFNLIRSGQRIVIAMDNDTAGKSSSESILTLCKDMNVEAWFFNYADSDVKDVGGMSLAEIKLGLDTAKHIIHGLKAIK